jgi:hypothetical protein
VFLYDRTTGRMRRISVNGTTQGNGDSLFVDVSNNAAKVAFETAASNLVPGDTNGLDDVVVWTRTTGKLTRVSVTSAGNQANGHSYEPSISSDGTRIAFVSNAPNLGAPPPSGGEVLVVRDTAAGKTYRMGTSDAVNDFYESSALSANGRRVGSALDSGSPSGTSSWHIVAVPSGRVLVSDGEAGIQLGGIAVNRDGMAYAVGEHGTGPDRLFVHNQIGNLYNTILNQNPTISADGLRVSAAGPDAARIWLWDTTTGKTIQVDVP